MNTFIRFLIILQILELCNSCSTKKDNYGWMDKYQAIICLTYDDGMKTQYETAIPQLNEFELKGTFFINNVSTRESIAAWRNASELGHELGNHTLFHPCPKSFGWPKEVTTDNYTVDLILEEVRAVNAILDITELETKRRSFAYPCNNMHLGDESYKDHLSNSKLITFARTGNDDQIVINRNDKSVDPMSVPSWIVSEDTKFDELRTYIDKVVNEKGIGILQFHGIGGEWISISSEDHYQLLSYLNNRKDSILVTTFTNAMNYFEYKRNKL